MQRDFIADLLYYIFSEDKKAHPMPPQQESQLLRKINALLKGSSISNDTSNEGD